jgi:ElaB/YqjD/DUF883 family membrane-anchored ribosome-binding protein
VRARTERQSLQAARERAQRRLNEARHRLATLNMKVADRAMVHAVTSEVLDAIAVAEEFGVRGGRA